MKIEISDKRLTEAELLLWDVIESLELSNVEIVFLCESIKLNCLVQEPDSEDLDEDDWVRHRRELGDRCFERTKPRI